jgi:hypothetical protein
VWDAATGQPVTGPLVQASGTIEQWAAVAERSPFVLNGIAVTLASAAQASTSASTPTELDDLALRLLEGLPPPPPLPE